MKKITILLILFSFAFSLKGKAQQPGDSKPLASHASFKGNRELRKEKRVQRRKKNLVQKSERVAKSNQKDVQERKFGIRKNKPKKENKESKHVATGELKAKN